MSHRIPSYALVALASLGAGCKNCSDDEAAAPPRAAPVATPTTPGQAPATAPTGATAPTTASVLLAPRPARPWPPTMFPTAEAALQSLSLEAPGPATSTADFDGDGTPDAYYAGAHTLLRHLAGGWGPVCLGTNSQPENTEGGAPLAVGGHMLVPITSHGHETDEGSSDTWQEAELIAFPANDTELTVWSSRIEENNGPPAGDYHFEALGGDAVLVSALMGDATPPGQSGAMFQVVRWDAASSRFDVASCWQTARPTSAPPAAPLCTASPGSSLHLRETQTLARESTSEYPAGTALQVLGAGTLRRGAATLHCVRAVDGQVGYAFLLPAELAGCPAPMPASP